MTLEMAPLAERTLPAVLRLRAEIDPDRRAMTDERRTLTYGELWAEALRVAGGLAAAGVRPGSRVAVLMNAHTDAVVAWAGIALAGGVHVALNTAYVGDLLGGLLARARPEVVLCDDEFLPRLAQLSAGPDVRAVFARGAEHGVATTLDAPVRPWEALTGHAPAEPHFPAAWELAEIKYTSGTTGFSKGVLVSHAQAYRHGSPRVPGVADRNDVNLCALPLFHLAGGWALVYNAFISGAEVVILPRFSASAFLDQARRYGATHTILLGGMADFLMAQPARDDDAENPLRVVYTMPVRPDFAAFEKRFGVSLYTAYGSTEANQPIFGRIGELRPGGCGTAVPDFDVRLVDPQDRPVPVGTVGELVVRPKEPWTTMLGYDGLPEETTATWRNLWFHTGDLMRVDEDGHYYFVGRVRDSIRHRGENIVAAEVESQILAHPSVESVAVIGVPNAVVGQDVMAVVVPAPGCAVEPAELIAFLRPRLARYMLPRFVALRAELPRTPTAKVRKRELEEVGVTPDTWDRETEGGGPVHDDR